ncbi:MAG TPA: amidohydrolase [Actinophytocola sp.]|uniref:amidohydrolase n=1 Tax=Actinophytocola sp. TaxID=1872138 RepID=UPI002DBB02BD|nr:amidohydrolase [Actinophytocola sp.]HEU5470924.1 amidohydrolase [Actinophytocola sp.]
MNETDLVIFTARLVHAQAGVPVAAFAVAGERIVAAGTPSGLRADFPRARVEDFGAATIVPGFNDAHIHIGLTAEDLLHLDLSHAAVATIDVLLDRVGARAATATPGEWVRGSRYDDTKTGVLTREALDAVAGAVPVLVTQVAGHWGVANSAALRALGYHEDSVPPPGGDLGRDAAGRLDGRLIERALLDVAYAATGTAGSPITPSTQQQRMTGLRRAIEQWHAAGLTSICDALVGPEDVALLHRARRSGDLTLRTGMLLAVDHYQKARELGVGSGFGDDLLRLVGVKSFVDGAIGGRTCLLSEPFTGTDYHGLQITDTDELRESIRRVHADGNRMGVHANGDTAIRLLLDIYAEIAGTDPKPGLRHRIEHCTVVDDDILRRMRALDLIAVPFAGYVAYHGGALESWYGPERVRRMFAHRSFLDAGVTVAGSSDYPCGPYQPLLGMQSMVTRQGIDDGVRVGENQRISAAEALAIYTTGSAAASGDEHRKGRLAPGFLADFVVLDQDPLTIDPAGIASIGVRHTYVGGRRVWSAG